MAPPSITQSLILAAAPGTNRGSGSQLSADAKGKRIVYTSGRSVFLRSIDDPAACRQYTGHTHPTTVARFAPNGFKVASGDAAGILRVWETESIESTRGEYNIISGPLNDIAWDADSQRVIAVGKGRESYGRCITADTGNSVGEIVGHTKAINAVSIKPKRPYRAVTVGDDGNASFFHGPPFKFNGQHALHKGFIFCTAYSPDGSTFVTAGQDKVLQLYDGTTGEPTKQIGQGEHSGSIFAVSWSEDSKQLVTASADRSVKLWDMEAGSVIQTWKLGNGVGVRDQQVGIVFPHGRTDGLIISLNLAGELTYLHVGKSEPSRVIQGHDKSITALLVVPNGEDTIAVTGSFDGRVCTWDSKTGIATIVDGHTHTNQVSQFAALAGNIYSVGWDDTLRAFDEPSKAFHEESVSLPAQPRSIATDGKNLYVATISSILVYSNGKLLKETPVDYTPEAIAVFDSHVAIGGFENSVQIYDSDSSGGLQLKQTITSPMGTVTTLAFSKDGSHLAAGNSLGKIYVYNTGTWQCATDRWSAHTARVTSIAWHESGKYAASGSLDTNIYVWCLEKKDQGTRIKAANTHVDGVTGVSWMDGGRLVSSGKDASVKVWDVKDLP